MFFSKKQTCARCKSTYSGDYSYCPYCGNSMANPKKDNLDYGMLGRTDVVEDEKMKGQIADANMTIFDKLIEATLNNFMKSMEKEMSAAMKAQPRTQITPMPNGVRIKVMPAMHSQQPRQAQKPIKQSITEEQLDRMAKMPRGKAKANIRRLSNKVIYEMDVPGLSSLNDVFVSKLENGYEIKAIGKKKIYANSLPIEMPVHSFKIEKDKLFVEFRQ